MILNLLIGLAFGILTGILALAPAYALPSTMTSWGHGLGEGVATANGIFPVTVLGACLAVIVLARVFIVGWSLIGYLYNKIPLKFT